jgi:hypothetical protein
LVSCFPILSSLPGACQFHFPSKDTMAGIRWMRTIVASERMSKAEL